VSLALVADYESRYGDVDSADATRVQRLLDDASALVVRTTGQTFTSLTYTDRLRVKHGRVQLPRPHVSAVTTVETVATTGSSIITGWIWDQSAQLVYLSDRTVINGPCLEDTTGFVDVTYTAGHATVPDDIVAIICAIAQRSFHAPSSPGLVAETIGAYSYRLDSQIGLATDEEAVLAGYRRTAGSIYAGAW